MQCRYSSSSTARSAVLYSFLLKALAVTAAAHMYVQQQQPRKCPTAAAAAACMLFCACFWTGNGSGLYTLTSSVWMLQSHIPMSHLSTASSHIPTAPCRAPLQAGSWAVTGGPPAVASSVHAYPVLCFGEATDLVLHTLTSPVWMLQTTASHMQYCCNSPAIHLRSAVLQGPRWFFVEGTCSPTVTAPAHTPSNSHSSNAHAQQQRWQQCACYHVLGFGEATALVLHTLTWLVWMLQTVAASPVDPTHYCYSPITVIPGRHMLASATVYAFAATAAAHMPSSPHPVARLAAATCKHHGR
jgi:hypothetical protein